jgi:PAS domain S-box-containing protein
MKSKEMPQLKRPNNDPETSSRRERMKKTVEADASHLYTQQLIQALPAATYTCDANGYILNYNKAAAALWGREPEPGKDAWDGAQKIYTIDGMALPLDQSPMAIVIKEGREIQDAEIIIERPDGTRRIVMPHPKPFFNTAGKVTGAVNMLLDITDHKNIEENNGHFAAIVESSDDAIISKTLESIVTSWNNSAERIFGYTAQEMIGVSITKIVPPDRLDEEPQILDRLKRGDRIDHFETKRLTKDGRLLDISLSISPVKNSKGVVIGASKIARDITAQKRAEQQIRESEERLRLAIESADLGSFTWNMLDNEFNFSERLANIYGYPGSKKLSYNDLLEAIDGEDRHIADGSFENALQTSVLKYEVRIVLPNTYQPVHWIRLNAKILFDEKQAPVKMQGIVMDITDQKKASDELEKMVVARTSELLTSNSALEKSNHELEQFAYIASHDLQEPLRKIQTFADMVKEHLHDSELTEKYFNKIYSSAKRMSSLINDVLNYSRLTKTGEQFQKTDLNKVLKDVLSDYELLIEQKQAVVISTDLPAIKGIPLQLHQLFANLISNSLKFSETKPVINITSTMLLPSETVNYPELQEDREYVKLVFTDNGIGFEQQYAKQIFIIFQRLNNLQSYSGTGIGLALCKKIVDHHDGVITAKSALGSGASFTIILPINH